MSDRLTEAKGYQMISKKLLELAEGAERQALGLGDE